VEHQPRPKLKEDRKIHREKVSDKKLCEHQHQLLRAEFISASASEQRMRGKLGRSTSTGTKQTVGRNI
jgi:hypothetical protein